MAVRKASVLLILVLVTGVFCQYPSYPWFEETWPQTFHEVPQATGILVGNTAQLNCTLQCVSGVDQCTGLIWTETVTSSTGTETHIYYSDTGAFNNANPNRNRYSVVSDTTNLLISDVKTNDAGRYICKPNRGGSDKDNKFAYLTVFEKSTCRSNGIAVEGGKASLTCNVKYHKTAEDEDNKTPSLRWLNIPSGEETGGRGDSEETKTVNFTVNAEDNGRTYTCETFYTPTPPYYSDTCNTPIVVHYGPKNPNITTDSPSGFSPLKPGEKLFCSASGNPPPTYMWEKVSGPSGVNQIFGSELMVSEDMEGVNTYRCIASNTLVNSEIKTASKNITFTVVGGSGRTDPSTQSPNLGGIIGGAVAGGVAFIVIIVIVVVMMRRRSKSPGAIHRDEEKQPGPPQTNPTMHHPDVIRPANKQESPYNMNVDDPRFRNVENLQYADLALDDTPRSRKPIQVYDIGSDTQYAEIQHGKTPY